MEILGSGDERHCCLGALFWLYHINKVVRSVPRVAHEEVRTAYDRVKKEPVDLTQYIPETQQKIYHRRRIMYEALHQPRPRVGPSWYLSIVLKVISVARS
jgi:hypothetical protein